MLISRYKNWPNDTYIESSPYMDKDEKVGGLLSME
jgi:hypothetical protein